MSASQVRSGARGSVVIPEVGTAYSDRPSVSFSMRAEDYGPVYRHGRGPGNCDIYGARDVWVWEADGTYFMHYDGAGRRGWIACLATSDDLIHWQPHGPILDFGKPGEDDSGSAAYGTTYQDDSGKWHMFYLATPNVQGPGKVPHFPYLTAKAESISPWGPWQKRWDITPFRIKPNTYYSLTASPGHIVRSNGEYLMFFSSTEGPVVKRSLGVARTHDLEGPWTVDPEPLFPVEEQVENSSLYYEEETGTWFLFTNHIGSYGDTGWADAVWVYWTKDINRWDSNNKAVVLDGKNCSWNARCVGLPSVLRQGDRLAIFYDSRADGDVDHMERDVGLAWLNLPLRVPGDAV